MTVKTSLRTRRRQRGWIMLMVLLLLLALGLSVTAYYTESEDHLFASQTVSAYNIAALRAEQGAEQALGDIRAATISPGSAIKNPCAATDPWTQCNTAGTGIVSNLVNAGTTLGLSEGGGLQYQYIVYHPTGTGVPTNLYTIRARGYYGYTLTSNNLYMSEVEVNVQTGGTGAAKCNNYDCS